MSTNDLAQGEKPYQDRLEIFTLGRFQVRFSGKPIFAEAGRSQKIGELFMYLITHRDRPASPEAILEALWPEQDYANPRNALKVLIHRMKLKLQTNGVSNASLLVNYLYGRYCWNRDLSYYLDVEAFETLCRQARELLPSAPYQAADKYREALALYRGDYLPECLYSDWVLPFRHYYRRLFVRSVSDLLALQKEHQLYSQLLEDCEKALFIDPFDEDLHLRYIEALLEEGKTTQARSHYQQITSLLYQELGAKPSPAMRRIYQTIVKKQEGQRGLNFNDLQKKLQERDRTPGAFLCDPDEFLLLCRLEKRRAEREDSTVHLAFLTLTGPDFQPPAAAQLQVSMEWLKQVLLSSLRRGDVITPWNESQFTLLLPGLSLEQGETVLQRIRGEFTQNPPGKGVILRSGIHPVLPWEDA